MSHAFKSMTYRLIHNRLVWLILVALIVIEVLTLCSGGETCFANHKTYSHHDHHSGTEITEYAVFEGKEYRVIGHVKDFLRMQYGDYMKLPPEEKTVDEEQPAPENGDGENEGRHHQHAQQSHRGHLF